MPIINQRNSCLTDAYKALLTKQYNLFITILEDAMEDNHFDKDAAIDFLGECRRYLKDKPLLARSLDDIIPRFINHVHNM